MLRPLSGATDELLGDLPESFTLISKAMTRLKTLLDVDSYNDMGKAEAHRSELDRIEHELNERLALPLRTKGHVAKAPQTVRQAWYSAYLNAWHYADSVGKAEDILSTVPMHTLPHFITHRCGHAAYQQTLEQLAETLHLDATFLNEVSARHHENLARLNACRTLLDWLRRFISDENGTLNQKRIFHLFSQLFPDQPLHANELNVVMTRTGVYWILPDPASLSADRDEAKTWIKRHRRFRFEQFTHFPMFCNFDSRDAEHSLLTTICEDLQWEISELRFQLDRSMMLETGGDIDKYLIHDSWGHIWQGYLSDLTTLYDRLATKQLPINADYHVALPDDNIVCLADCLYLLRDGSVDYDESLAVDYIHAVIQERVTALLSPICAELCADIIEYSFHADYQGTDISLPSSSLFKHRAAKLDFAWADMQYFAKALARPIRQYQRDDNLRIAMVQRLCSLLRLKYANNSAAIDDKDLFTAVDRMVSQFIDRFVRIQEDYLKTNFTTTVSDGSASTTTFARIFANLLRIQFAINECYEQHLAKGKLKQGRHLIHFFIIHYFQQNPAAHFWSLDEQLAEWCLPFVSAITDSEKQHSRS